MTSHRKTSEKIRCILLGGGGHALVVIESLRSQHDVELVGILDSNSKLAGKEVMGIPILGNDDQLAELKKNKQVEYFTLGLGSIGSSKKRQQLFELGVSHLKPLTVIHPAAICSGSAMVGEGSQLLPGSIVNAGAKIGKNVIVNSGAVVEHGCVIEDHVHVATGALLAGGVTVAMGAHIGIGASIRECLSIGERAIIGAGAVIVKNVPSYTVVAGVPARTLRVVEP